MRFGSLFAGIGGFDLGLERAGMECAWQVEIDKHCQVLLATQRSNVERYTDVRGISNRFGKAWRRYNHPKPVDLVCGGFPCQDLSVAGRRAGLAGGRSGLWWEFARIINEFRPRWVIIENVPGLLSSNKGRDMGILTGKLAEIGYWWAYRVLDAQYFGLAQRRKRVFIVAHSTEPTYPAKVLFEPESGERDTPPSRETGKISPPLTATGVGAGRTGNERNELDFCIPEVAPPLDTGYKEKQGSNQQFFSQNADGFIPVVGFDASASSPNPTEDIMPTMRSREKSGWSAASAIAFNSNSMLSDNPNSGIQQIETTRTLDTLGVDPNKNQGGTMIVKDVGVRRLTPLECERLQGFPDGWTEGHSDTARYRMLGNAVAVPVAEWIAKRIVALESS